MSDFERGAEAMRDAIEEYFRATSREYEAEAKIRRKYVETLAHEFEAKMLWMWANTVMDFRAPADPTKGATP